MGFGERGKRATALAELGFEGADLGRGEVGGEKEGGREMGEVEGWRGCVCGHLSETTGGVFGRERRNTALE